MENVVVLHILSVLAVSSMANLFIYYKQQTYLYISSRVWTWSCLRVATSGVASEQVSRGYTGIGWVPVELSSLDSCNVLLAGLPCATIEPLQQVQNATAETSCAVTHVLFRQGSSLLWTHMLRPFYSRPIALIQEGRSLVNDVCECVCDWRV